MDIESYVLAKDYTDKEIANIPKPLIWKDTVATYDNLPPLTDVQEGWVYSVADSTSEYACVIVSGTKQWNEVGSTIVFNTEYNANTNKAATMADIPDITDKLTEPSSGIEAGKWFKVASVDENGHPVLACVNLPVATSSARGTVKVNGLYGINLYNDTLIPNLAPNTISGYSSRNGYNCVSPYNIDYAVGAAMTDGIGPTWTDAQKNGCYKRTTIRKSTLDNVLVPNAQYNLGSLDQVSITLTLPTPSGTDNFSCNDIYVAFKSGSTATTLSIVGDYEGDTSYLPGANCICELSFKYICGTWVLLAKDTPITTVANSEQNNTEE